MAVKALGEAVEHATDRYRQGLANYAYAQLYRALGGGWALTDAQWSGQGEATTK